MNIVEAIEEYNEKVKQEIEKVKKCKCQRVRKLAMEILTNPWLKVRGDDYGLIQLWCTVCDDGVTIHKPAIEECGEGYTVR